MRGVTCFVTKKWEHHTMNLTLDQICEVIVKLQKLNIPVPTDIVNEYWRLIKKEK